MDVRIKKVKPLCIDLFCGLGGWTEGFLTEGYECVGFDIERHEYGSDKYPGQLVLQDVRTLHGSQFKDADCIVASPPCQKYSYMAMPWSRAKQMAAEYRSGVRSIEELNELFNACFRIAKEAGVPLIVENVRGAEPWVGQAAWNYGSFYLWGNVPALMPSAIQLKGFGGSWFGIRDGKAMERRLKGERIRVIYRRDGNGGWIALDGTKIGGDWFSDPTSTCRKHGSRSLARKAASAHIAKIPLALSRHIARCYKPTGSI